MKLLEPLMKAGLYICLQFAQRGRLQNLKVNLKLVGVGLGHGGLSALDDVHHAAQFQSRQPVNVKAQLVLFVVRHRQHLVV